MPGLKTGRAFFRNGKILVGSSGSCCFLRDRAGRLAYVCDDYVCSMGRAHALWVGDVTDVEGIAKSKLGNVHFQSFWKVVWKAGDFDGVNVLLKEATGFHAYGFTVEVSRDVCGDFRAFIDGKEVSVKHYTGKWIVLNGLEECEAGAFTFDIQVHEDVLGAAVSENVCEKLRVNLEVVAFGAASVDHGRNPAFAAHLIEAAGAGACAECCFDGCLLGHGGKCVRIWKGTGQVTNTSAGARCVAVLKPLVKNLFVNRNI